MNIIMANANLLVTIDSVEPPVEKAVLILHINVYMMNATKQNSTLCSIYSCLDHTSTIYNQMFNTTILYILKIHMCTYLNKT